MKRFIKWVKEHIRPHIKYIAKAGEEIDLSKDTPKEAIEKGINQTEVGVKFTFKF